MLKVEGLVLQFALGSALNCVQMDGNVDKLVGGRWGGV